MLGTIKRAEAALGHIDLLCNNAGISVRGGPEVDTADWQRIWEINVMAHVWASRAALPAMLERGDGYILNTASAAGLLSQIGSAPYAVTKHARFPSPSGYRSPMVIEESRFRPLPASGANGNDRG